MDAMVFKLIARVGTGTNYDSEFSASDAFLYGYGRAAICTGRDAKLCWLACYA